MKKGGKILTIISIILIGFVILIGDEFGGRDHTTIMHSCEVITKQLQIDESLNDTLSIIKKDIRDYKKNS